MKINGYEFTINPRQLDHLARHIEDDQANIALGSYFMAEVFSTSLELVEFSVELIRRKYHGVRKELEVDFPHAIGYDGVTCLDNLPAHAELSIEQRSSDGSPVNVVRGIVKPKTRHMVVVAGPKGRGRRKDHIIYTAYCGTRAPYSRDPGHAEFWRNHGFIVSEL